MSSPTLIFIGTEEDKSFVPRLKPMVGTAHVFVSYMEIVTLAAVVQHCKKRNITGVISTSQQLLSRLLLSIGNPKSRLPSMEDYAGSYFLHDGIEFVFINPLEQLVTVPYMSFLTRRFVSKLVAPETWNKAPAFAWELLTVSNYEQIFSSYESAIAIAVDIETRKEPLCITSISYTGIFLDSASQTLYTHTCVLDLQEIEDVWIMRKFNEGLKAPKILQNGKYDSAYLARYNAPLYNYLWDTANMFHCWYAELPKDLAFLFSFFIRTAMYWKDLAESTDKYERLKYNGLDTFGTALVFIEWILQAPDWAKNNYLMEFPVVFPSHMCEMRGIKRDMNRLHTAAAEVQGAIDADNVKLSKMVGTYPAIFNVNSAPQNKALRAILGCADVASSDEKSLKKIGARHPLNRKITDKILDLRGNRKLISTYLVEKEFNGRILYSINPHATDTGRNASREHHFWCGLQIQNIPRGKSVKQTLVADEGFMFAEVDLEQAESRDTAYISGDEAMIAAVSGENDFHSTNASAFFGIPYNEIFDNATHSVINKPIRQLSKNVNHGASYNMGEDVLIETMGEENIWEAKRLLKLPTHWGLRDVAKYLLSCFHKAYPDISGKYYKWVLWVAETTRMFTGATGWTRYTFLNPKANKLHLNALIAHNPQSLNAMVLNKAFVKVFWEIAMSPKYAPHFKLIAQIHDSILFQFRIGHEYLMEMVRERMEIPVTVTGCDGKVRTFTVPAAIKGGKDGKGAKYWSDTE